MSRLTPAEALDVVARAVARFPETFGMKPHIGDKGNMGEFRISRTMSEMVGDDVLFTILIKQNYMWVPYTKLTPIELRERLITISRIMRKVTKS